jgi:hypothetical protein
VVANHLNTLVGLTVAGGTSLFVTDLVSSNLFPVTELRSSPDLRESMNRIVASGHSYHSANPTLIEALLAEERLGAHAGEPELLDPWLWTGRLDRTYFVYALRIPRRA